MPKQIHHTFHSEIKPPMSHCFLDNMVMSSPRLHHGQSCQQHHRRIAYSDECSFSYAARCIYPTPYSVSALPYMAFSPHIPQSLISSRVSHFSLIYPARLSINASYQTEQSLLAFHRSLVPARYQTRRDARVVCEPFLQTSQWLGRSLSQRPLSCNRPCLLRGFRGL